MPLSNKTFLSSSDIVSCVKVSDGKRYYDVDKKGVAGFGGKEPIADTLVQSNMHIYEPISGSDNTLGFPKSGIDWSNFSNNAYNKTFCNGGFANSNKYANYFNTIMNKRNGSYQNPSWKQIRNSEHPLVRWQRDNNIIAFLNPAEVKNGKDDSGNYITFQEKRGNSISLYVEPAVVINYPIIMEIKEGKYLDQPLKLQFSYSNIIDNFSNEELNKKLKLSRTTNTVYDRIKDLYLGESPENRVIDGINRIIIKECIFPSKTNFTQDQIRKRKNFDIGYWRDKREDRKQYNVYNSQGYLIPTQSRWCMDARDSFGTSEPLTASNGEGELQNKYTTFFGEDRFVKDPCLQGDFVNRVAWFNVSPYRDNLNKDKPYLNTWVSPPADFDNTQCVMSCSSNWDSIIGNAATASVSGGASFQTFSISMWIYVPNAYNNHVKKLPDKQCLIEFGCGDRGLYLTTGSAYNASITNSGSNAYNDVLFEQNSTYGRGYRGLVFSSSFENYGWDGGEWVAFDSIRTNTWYNIVATFDPNQTAPNMSIFYINGIEYSVSQANMINTFAPTRNPSPISTNMVYIGSSSHNWKTLYDSAAAKTADPNNWYSPAPYFGMIKDVSIFNTKLTSTEANEIYNSGYPKSLFRFSKTENLVSWWRMGDGIGIYTASALAYGNQDDTWSTDNNTYAYYRYFLPLATRNFSDVITYPFTSSLFYQTKNKFNDRIGYMGEYPLGKGKSRTSFDVEPYIYEQAEQICFDMVGNRHLISRQRWNDFLFTDSQLETYGQLKYIDCSELTRSLFGDAQKDRGSSGEGPNNWASDFKVGAMFSRPELVYKDTNNAWITSSGNTYYKSKEVTNAIGEKIREERYYRVTGSRIAINEMLYDYSSYTGKKPFYNNYDDYCEVINKKGREYSLIPEFRISERMNFYLDDSKGNFLASDNNFLSLTGSSYENSNVDDFYKVYSHTDFIKNFEVVNEDYKNDLNINNLKLKCKAIMKFIPYEGFYPAQRTLQLAQLFSQSYGDNVNSIGYKDQTYTTKGNSTQHSWRSFTTPFFGPGILYNSIKSGMAVDFPIYTNYDFNVIEDYKSLYGGGIDYQNGISYYNANNDYSIGSRFWGGSEQGEDFASILLNSTRFVGIYGFPYNATSSMWLCDSSTPYAQYNSSGNSFKDLYLMNLNCPSYSAPLPKGLEIYPLELDKKLQWYTCLSDNFDKRISFEALVEPENYIAKEKIYDMNPEYSSSLRHRLTDNFTNQSSYWGGEGKNQYKLAMHNFLAETTNFFLKNKKMTTISSKPIPKDGIVIRVEDADKWYGMDVYISNSKCKNYTDFRECIAPYLDTKANVFYSMTSKELDDIKGIHTKMYSRDSAFGPPWVYNDSVFTSSYNMFSFHFGYEPFTPAYFNGFGVARIMFYPFKGAGTYSIEEIQQGSKIYYYRAPTNREGRGSIYKYDKMIEFSSIMSVDEENILEKTYEHMHEVGYSPRSSVIREFYSSNLVANSIKNSTKNWQQLDSTLNLFGKIKVKNISYEKGVTEDFSPSSIIDDPNNSNNLWVIQPKWETPIFNFKDKVSFSSSYSYENSNNLTGGIWSQYGDFCSDKNGIWMGISDLPNKRIDSYKLDFEIGQKEYVYEKYISGHMDLKSCTGQEKTLESCFLKDKTCDYKNYFPLGVGYYFNRRENQRFNKTKKGEIILYISDYTVFPNYSDDASVLDFLINENNFNNTEIYIRRSTFVSNYDYANYISYLINENKKRMFYNPHFWITTEVFIPENHPFKEKTSVTNPVVAIKIKLNNNIDNYPIHCPSVENKKVSFCFGADGFSGEDSSKVLFEGIDKNGNKTYRMAIQDSIGADIPEENKIYFSLDETKSYDVQSLADLVGFPKTQKRMGEVEDEGREIKEAIVAIPFTEQNGRKNFFSIPRRDIDIASGKKKPLDDEKVIGESIYNMVNKMKDYVFPPTMDFLTNESINPFAMYIFEFKHVLSKQDLGDIWQNISPEIGTSFKTDESVVEHQLLSNEFFKGKLENNLRWMIFKVKQKAKINYYETTVDQSDDDRFKFTFNVGGDKTTVVPKYSYNWPYDYFSLVELAKIEAEIDFKKKQ